MARRFRLWEKKRGGRRTGSKLLGSVGEAIFFVVLFLTGTVLLIVLLTSLGTRRWPASSYFPEVYLRKVTGHIETKRLARLEPAGETPEYCVELTVAYDDDHGEKHHGVYQGPPHTDKAAKQAELDAFTRGEPISCWYDPADPAKVRLTRPSPWRVYLAILVLGSFILIGGGGVIYTALQVGTSAERRAAIAKRAAGIELIRDVLPSRKDYPNVPRDANLTNSPGTTLTYRLPIAQSPGWRLLAAASFCLLWNSMAAVFVVLASRSHFSGRPDWLLTMATGPCLAVGVWAIYYFLKEFLLTTWIGPTSIEISELPLFPNGCYEIFVTQSGQLEVHSLRVLLVCEEEATYRQGTDVRNEVKRVFEDEVFCHERFDILPGKPFSYRCHLMVPPGSMHSFQTDNNAVRWKLIVENRIAGWPDYERHFPIVVYPVGDGKRNL